MDSAHLPIAECPAEGCDGGPFETEAALRGHTNARSGPDHPSWGQVQQLIEERSDSQEGGQDPDQREPGDGADEEAGEDTDEMPTQQEYEEQHTDDGSDGDTDTGTDTSGGGAAPLPMDPKTLGLLLAVALVLWLAYRRLGDAGGDGQGVDQAEPGDGAGADTSSDGGEIEGGLAG